MAVNDGRRKDDIEETNFIQSFYQMKQAASQQVLFLSDATASLGKGLRKSIKCYKNEAKDLARSINECLDVDDALKTIHEVIYPEEHALRKSSVVHTPIDWSKYPPSAFRKFSHEQSATIREDSEDELDEDVNHEEKDGGMGATIHQISPSGISLNHSTAIRSNHLDSIDEKRSLYCNTDADKRTKSLDDSQVVEPKTTSSKRRTQSVSSYPIDIPKETNIVKKNSLQVNSIKTIRDYRCPSPRPSRKEIRKDSTLSDDHKTVKEGERQQLDKTKDDGDVKRNSLQVKSIKTSKRNRCPSPRPSRKEIKKGSALSDDHKTANGEVRQQLDDAFDEGDVQKDILQVESIKISKGYRSPSPRHFRKDIRRNSSTSDNHNELNEDEGQQLDETKDEGDVQRISLQVESTMTSRVLRCLSPRPSRKEIIKNSNPSYNDEIVDEEVRYQLDKANDDSNYQKNSLQVDISKSNKDRRCPSPRPSRREMRKTNNLFDDHDHKSTLKEKR